MADGLHSALMSLRAHAPAIRYDEGSQLCQLLAQELDQRLEGTTAQTSKATTVLILDRREDPVTPLLNQWTYQAMIHEILGINKNRVDLSMVAGLSEEMKEIVLSCHDDEFFRNVMFANFGEVADAIHELVQKFLQNKKSQAQFSTIEDMQRVIENFPEFKKGERNTTKHFNLLEELRRNVDKNQLYEVSELEQEIVSGPESRTKHLKAVMELAENDKLNDDSALRLLLLYSLRHENDEKVSQLKQ